MTKETTPETILLLDVYQDKANAFINRPQYSGQMDYLLNTALGLTGEGGEFGDLVKKLRFHGHPFTDEVRTKLIKELGDVLWYVAQGCLALEICMSEVAEINIRKLTDRHRGNTFSEAASINKDEAKEAVGAGHYADDPVTMRNTVGESRHYTETSRGEFIDDTPKRR